MQDLWDIIKKSNLQTIDIEGEEVQAKDILNIFSKVIAKNSQILRER
jgi:hypothetical protein